MDGVNVAVADSGLHTGEARTMHPDLAGRPARFLLWQSGDASDEHGHGTHCAGSLQRAMAHRAEVDETGACTA